MEAASAEASMVRPPGPAGNVIHDCVKARMKVPLSMAPTKLKIAAKSTAMDGVRARVRVDRATALETSRKPLRNANPEASPTTRTRKTMVTSGFLDDDAAYLGGDL